ncbi:anthranilate 1,2-dioxygenase electron transfer component AntC [Thiolinea disciformis]|uniref:anthranilate 1,2-dioxygenase electron transfer component AntC n=1 Tax=Thiolinea disciformis TaxID=125614 RepID=UPI00036F0656|nr:anthranilate 1,2-dioxygenase electron transfer component AntC [Thiolinea disciformis]
MPHTATLVFRDGHTATIEVRDKELLMDAARRHGVNLPVDCREGVCATCRGICETGKFTLDYVDSDALTKAELAKGHILACQTRLQSDGVYSFDVDSKVCKMAVGKFQGTVTAIEKVSEAAATLTLALSPSDKPLRYMAGQYARLNIPNTDQWRAYSFANASADTGSLRFLIRLLPSGVMSDYVRERCKVGDVIQMEAPMGVFYLRKIERPLVMIAGGTGLSAFLAMLESLTQQTDLNQAIRLYYGVNQEADLSELQRLDAFKTQLADFDYKTVIMRPSESWQGNKGVVTDILDLDFLQQAFDAYLCGPPAMIEASRAWLDSHKVAEHHFYFEKFISS